MDSRSRLNTSSCSASSSDKSSSLSDLYLAGPFALVSFSFSSLKDIFRSLSRALRGTASFSIGFGSLLVGEGLGDLFGVSGGLYLGSSSNVGSGVFPLSSGVFLSVSESDASWSLP